MLTGSTDAVLHNPRIPTLPMVAVQVLRLAREENLDLHRLAQIVQNDQALAVKIMRTVNSSYYGLAHPCASIQQAVVYLGANAAKSLVLGFSLVESIDGKGEHDVGFDYVDYWRRALYTATAAKEIAGSSEVGACDPEDAFLAALVQDIGMIALYRTYGDIYLQVIDMTKGDHSALADLEARSLHTDHAVIGGAMLQRWKFPPSIVHAARHHHGGPADKAMQSDETTASDRSREAALAQCIELAGNITAAAAVGEVTDKVRRRASDWFGIDSAEVDELVATIGRAVPELARLLQVNVGEGGQEKPFDHEEVMADAEDLRVEHTVTMTRELDRLSTCEEDLATSLPTKETDDDERAHRAQRDELLLQLGENFQIASTSGASFALLLLEIDEHEESPSHSAEASGAIVEKVRGRLRESLGESDLFYHIEPAKFALAIAKSDRRHAARKAESLRQSVGDMESTSVSVGIATVEPALEAEIGSAPALLRIAEKALESAKRAGGNSVRIFSPAAREKAAA